MNAREESICAHERHQAAQEVTRVARAVLEREETARVRAVWTSYGLT